MTMDMFGHKPELRLPSGQKKYNTCIGYLCSLLFYALIVFYIYGIVAGSVERDVATTITTTWVSAPMSEVIKGDSPVGFALIDTHNPDFVPDATRVKLSVKKRMWNYVSADNGSGPT